MRQREREEEAVRPLVGLSLLAGIEAAATARPGGRAVQDSRGSLTFGELWEASGRAANALMHAGVRTGDRVAVTADKRVETVAALLAVMRCGAAFVPIDPAAPDGRVAALLADANPRVVVGPVRGAAAAPSLSLDEVLAPGPDEPGDLPVVGDDDVAYCMYTSGSSGQPKGVQIDHAAIAAFIAAVDPLMEVDSTSRCFNTSPFFFDVSVVDVWYPLAKGASIHLSESFLVPDRVLDILERERITHFSAVGSILTLLRRARVPLRDRDLGQVVRIMTGAEVVDPATVREWLAAVPGATIFNGYGPTEATCCCFAHPITVDNVDEAPYPIGRPFPATRALVVGHDDEPCPPGHVGELLLAGPQVTIGYLKRPEENGAKFVVRDGARWYRTGDLVVEDERGIFHFKGRRDHELKVRGYRIHPAEITTVLHRCDGVAEAHVTAITDERGERILAAAVAPLPDASVCESTLQAQLRAGLPEYMVPRRILVVPTLPKLPSGKIDDRELGARLSSSQAPGEDGR